MSSNFVDFFSMLQGAQSNYQNSLQQNSVDAFFKQASANQNGQLKMPPSSQPIGNHETIERQIINIPNPNENNNLSQHQNNLANSPLAQFISNGNGNQSYTAPTPQAEPPVTKPMNARVPPGFAVKPVQLITPTMLAEKKTKPEPLTQNQLLQAFNYLIANDDEFKHKLHDAYVKSFMGSSS